jgi:hypothetical protein
MIAPAVYEYTMTSSLTESAKYSRSKCCPNAMWYGSRSRADARYWKTSFVVTLSDAVPQVTLAVSNAWP